MTSYALECFGDITIDGIMPSSTLKYADMKTGDVLFKTHPDGGPYCVYWCNFARDGEAIHIREMDDAADVHMHNGLIVWDDSDACNITCYDTKTRSIRYILDARNYLDVHSSLRGLEDKFCIICGNSVHTFDLDSGDLLETHVTGDGKHMVSWSVNPLVITNGHQEVEAASLGPYTRILAKKYDFNTHQTIRVSIVRPGCHMVMIDQVGRIMVNIVDGEKDETFYIDNHRADYEWGRLSLSGILCTDHYGIVIIAVSSATVVYDLRTGTIITRAEFAPGERIVWYDYRLAVTLTSRGKNDPGFTLRKYRLASAETKAARKLQ